MPLIDDLAGYWDHYAAGVADETPEQALKDAFGWTQYPGHGPGDELLGDPATTLELGFGCGSAVAALATKGIDATGIDIGDAWCRRAKDTWGHLPGARFEHGDVLSFLAGTGQHWETIYSIFGAFWFTDPELLLPLIRARLAPGGKLVFSQAPAVPGSYGIQGMYGNGFTGRKTWIYRWAYEPDDWTAILRQHGFHDISARIHPAPDPGNVGTLLIEAH